MVRTVATYQYDGLGRRIVRTIDNSGALDATYHDYHDGQRLIETRNYSNAVLKQHVWGLEYIDELIQVAVNGEPVDDPGFDPDDPDHDARYHYALLNANYNVVILLDAEGLVAERYQYEPYVDRNDRIPFAAFRHIRRVLMLIAVGLIVASCSSESSEFHRKFDANEWKSSNAETRGQMLCNLLHIEDVYSLRNTIRAIPQPGSQLDGLDIQGVRMLLGNPDVTLSDVGLQYYYFVGMLGRRRWEHDPYRLRISFTPEGKVKDVTVASI